VTDKLSAGQRSANMRAVRSRDTKPEIRVRQIVHGLGYRFRLYRRDLPGTPDLAFISRRKAVFVHGCFWHQHKGCRRGKAPTTNTAFWHPKLTRNAKRDAEQLAALKTIGWRALVVWECQLNKPDRLSKRLRRFLGA
jgi:DNA mismatch endonuclease, patch repair protein